MPELQSSLLRVLPFVVVLLVFGFRIKKGKLDRQKFFLQKPDSWKTFLIWWTGFLLLVLLTEICLAGAGLLEVERWNYSIPVTILRLAGIVILAPVTEELIFRGLLLSKLKERNLNDHAAIVIQALVFVLLHNFAWQNTLSSNIGVVQSFVDALLYAYAKNATRSIYTPMAMHATGNMIAVMERLFL